MGDELAARPTLRDAKYYLKCAREAMARQDHDAVRRELTTVVEKVQNCGDHLETEAKRRGRTGGCPDWWAKNGSRLDDDDSLGLLRELRDFTVHVEPLGVTRHVHLVAVESLGIASTATVGTPAQGHPPNTGSTCEQDPSMAPGAAASPRASGVSIQSDTWRFRAGEGERRVIPARVLAFETLLERDARDLCADALGRLEELVAEAEERWVYGHDSAERSDS